MRTAGWTPALVGRGDDRPTAAPVRAADLALRRHTGCRRCTITLSVLIAQSVSATAVAGLAGTP